MLELHQGAGIETIHPLPLNLAPRGRVIGDFLNFRIAGRYFGMAQHAFGNGWDGRARTGIRSAVTI